MVEYTVEELRAEMQKGRELMALKCFEEAVEVLSANVQKWCEKFGEMGPECAEAYMRYGIALTRECEEAEEQNGGADVFGASVPQEIATGAAPEGEAKEGEAKEGEAKEGEAKEGESKPEAEMMEEMEDEEDGGEEEGEEGGEEGEEEGEEEEGGEGAEKGEVEKEDDKGKGPKMEKPEYSDDPLELAWTVLEVARNIFEKEETKVLMADCEKDRKLMLADTYCYMGDIGLRNEKFEQCENDYKTCLALREEVCEKDDRLLMEVHHQLAMAYSFNDTPNKPAALEALRNAIATCELRLKNLRTMICMGGDEPCSIPGSSVVVRSRGDMEQELNEMEMICVDLQEKLESESIDDLLDPDAPSTSSAGDSKAPANPFGGDAIAAMAAQAGFGAVPDGAAVKTLGVFGKKAKQNQTDASATPSVGDKRAAEDTSCDGDSKKAKATVEELPSATPLQAKENGHEHAPVVTA